MALHIHMEPRFIDAAASMPLAQRQFVEQAKVKNQVDDILQDACDLHRQRHAGLEDTLDATQQTALLAEIRDTLDVAIALVAVCQDVDEVEGLKRLAVCLGRRYQKPVKVNEQELQPRLKAVFAEIADQYSLHTIGDGDRAMIRRKVTAVLTILNDALANKRTR